MVIRHRSVVRTRKMLRAFLKTCRAVQLLHACVVKFKVSGTVAYQLYTVDYWTYTYRYAARTHLHITHAHAHIHSCMHTYIHTQFRETRHIALASYWPYAYT